MSRNLTGHIRPSTRFLTLACCLIMGLFLGAAGCSSTLDLYPVNPCDPLYQGDQPCAWHQDQTPQDTGTQQELPDTSTTEPDTTTTHDTGIEPTPPCLDDNYQAGEPVTDSLLPQWCYIDEQCHREGDQDPGDTCRYCNSTDPDHTAFQWSHEEDGTLCTVVIAPDQEGEEPREEEGACVEGTCVARAHCRCSGNTACCDGCHPINTGDECHTDDLLCTTHLCSEEGTCEMILAEGWCLSELDGTCTDSATDPLHCGQCGHQCPPDHTCAGGECLIQCDQEAGLTACSQMCVDLSSNQNHCGECDHPCSPEQECVSGSCMAPCVSGQVRCGEECANLGTNQNHCGECHHPCEPGAVCTRGSCITRVTGIILQPTTLDLAPGEEFRLNAAIQPDNATNQAVSWTSGYSQVATVDAEGNVTGVGVGQTQIIVATADGNHTDQCQVTVRKKVTGVTLNHQKLSIQIGNTATLIAQVSPPDAENPSVTWASSAPSIADVDHTGMITARNYGNATITVTTVDRGLTASCLVTVVDTPVMGIRLAPPVLELFEGSTGYLTATLVPANATLTTITWSSSQPSVATADPDGLVTAHSGGQTIITVRAVDGGFTESSLVKVMVPVTGITLTPPELLLAPGATYLFNAEIHPPTATNPTILWSSANPGVATVDDQGKVTGVSPGTTVVTSAAEEGNFSATSTVEIRTDAVGVSLEPMNLTLNRGETAQLTATVFPLDAENKTVLWASSNPGVASVDENGLVTSHRGGNALITATAEASGQMASCYVAVVVPVTGFYIEPTSLRVPVGDIARLTPVFSPSDATNRKVAWSSEHYHVAEVSPQGLVTGHYPGPTTITAITDDGGYMDHAHVEVYIPVTGVILTPPTASLEAGDSVQLTASILPPEATDQGVTWTSSNPNIATVNEYGAVVTTGPGTATITATSVDGEHSALCTLTIIRRVTGVTVTPVEKYLYLNQTQQFIATVSPSDATDKRVTWTSANPSTASVSDTGLVTCRNVGDTPITVTTVDRGRTFQVGVRCAKKDEGGGGCSTTGALSGDPTRDVGSFLPGLLLMLGMGMASRIRPRGRDHKNRLGEK